MITNNLQERVFALVREKVWHRCQPALVLATRLAAELGLDSLGRVQLGILLEDGLKIDIPDTELGQWDTLAEVLACVERQLPTDVLPTTSHQPRKRRGDRGIPSLGVVGHNNLTKISKAHGFGYGHKELPT